MNDTIRQQLDQVKQRVINPPAPTSTDSTAQRLRERRITSKEAFIELCKSFPCVRDRFFRDVTAENFDAVRMFNRPNIQGCSSGEARVMSFLASVWDPHHTFDIGLFVFQQFMDVDSTNRRAFIAWVVDPFWP